MSRTRLLRRLERLLAQVEALESVIDTRGLESLSDEELDALYLELGGEPDPEPFYRVVTSRGVEEAVSEELLPALPEPEEPEQALEPHPTPVGSEKTEETSWEGRIRRSNDLPEPSPRRGEWLRVTLRPYRPPGRRPRAVQERAFSDD
ncbi:MAG: hypothetical protein ACRDOS_09065 [Gaiellaceae bacterium]